MINVSKPYLPPLEQYIDYLQGIWDRNWLTNNGPLVNELELRLKEHLGLDHLLYVSNGTIALQIAIKALELKGDIITTPFSYVATTSSIVWENCRPVFVDIDPLSLNIDPKKIAAAITPNTTGILATHVYGNPCDIDAIQNIADQYQLKVIYDAAHCFGSQYKGKSVLDYGDISTCSFHATKLFHTIEGGSVSSSSPELTRKMALLRNFGHTSAIDIQGIGVNGKNSEFHAAMGLLLLSDMLTIQNKRKEQWIRYRHLLKGLRATVPKIDEEKAEYNYSYFPIIFENENLLLKSIDALNKQYIFPRRYFYPALNQLDYVDQFDCPIAEDKASRIICLPLYHKLSKEEQEMIARILLRTQNY